MISLKEDKQLKILKVNMQITKKSGHLCNTALKLVITEALTCMSRNAHKSDLRYFILDTIICNFHV